MKTKTNYAFSWGVPSIRTLLEISAERPTVLLEQLLAIRIKIQSYHASLCPFVMKVRQDDSMGDPTFPWVTGDMLARGLVTKDRNDPLNAIRNWEGIMPISPSSHNNLSCPTHPCGLSPVAFDQWQWFDMDLDPYVYHARPLVTTYDEGAVPTEWLNAVEQVASLFHRQALRGFEATNVGWDRTIAPAGFLEALKGFPAPFVKAMCTLAGEIDNLVGHIAPLAGNGQEENEFEQCDAISKACIGALVPGIRALTFHGFGWPILNSADAKVFLSKLRHTQPVAVELIGSVHSDIDQQQREELLGYLFKAGLISMEGSLVSVVEPTDFLANQIGTLARNEDAGRIETLT